MGLEIVDVVINLENALRIQIPDDEFVKANIRTVGDFHDYLVGRIPEMRRAEDDQRCLTSHIFYRLRQSLCTATGLSAKLIRPTTTLDEIRRESGVSELRTPLSEATGLKLPGQGWSGICSIIMVSCVVLVASAFWMGQQAFGAFPGATAFWVVVSVGLGCLLGYYAAAPYRPDFDSKYRTVADLTRAVITWNLPVVREEYGKLTPSDVWSILQETLIVCVSVKIESVERDTKLTDILG